MKQAISIISFCLIIYSVFPYLVDIVRKKTKPNIVTWFTWTLLTGIGTAAAFAAGEPRSALVTLATAITTGSVVILGFKYGIAKMTWFDGICQISAVFGLVLWFVFNSPLIAIVLSLTIDFVAWLPTLKHSWLEPSEETWQAYMLASIGAVLPLFVLSPFTAEGFLFPFYLFIADGLLAVVIIYRRKQLNLKLSRNE